MKLLKLLSIILCIVSTQIQSLHAQETYESNVVKLNLSAMAFRNFQFQYERMLTPKISVALAGRIMPEGKIPMLGLAEKFIDDLQTFQDMKNLKVKGTSIQPEVRFYLGKGEGPKGFYLAPYATFSTYPFRYTDFVFELEETVRGNTYVVEKKANLDGHIKGVSGGLMIGAQWKLGKLLSLDWWIIGASYGASKGALNAYVQEELSQEWKDALKERLDEIELPKFNTNLKVHNQGVRGELSGPWANLRTGLSLGIRF